jgi:PAS domain S-box-containing protein
MRKTDQAGGKRALRRQAAEKLKDFPEELEKLTLEEVRRLAQGLRVHQLELERENEELRRTREHLENLLQERTASLGTALQSVGEEVEERRAAQEEWERTFNAVPDLIAIMDREHRVVRANRAMAAALGLKPEELVGRCCYEAVHRVDRPPPFCPHALAMAQGREVTTEVQEMGRHFLVTATPLQDREGRLSGSVHVARDITALKEAEEEIRRQANFPRLNPNPVLEVDEEGRVLYANPAAWRAAERLGLPEGASAFLPRDLKERFAAVREGGPREQTLDLILKDATYAVMLSFPHDLPTARLYAMDITVRKQAEEELRQALGEAERRQQETQSLFRASRAVMEQHTFRDTAWEIFQECKALTGATGGYVALLSGDGSENELLFLDAGGLPCTVAPDLPMPIRGLRAEAYSSGRVVYDNDFPASRHAGFLPPGHVALENVLFAPLINEGKAVGLMGLANKPGGFTPHDAFLAAGFGDLAAIALAHQQAGERLKQAHDKLEQRVKERTRELHLAMEQLEREIEERRQAEEFSQDLFASSLIGIYLIQDNRFRLINSGFREITGYDEDEIREMDFQSMVHPEDREWCRTHAVQMLKGADQRPYEYRIISRGGEVKWILETVVSTEYKGRRASLGNFMDITDRKRAEEALRQQARIMEAFFTHTITPMVFLDRDFNFIRVNEAYARACQRPVSDFPGHNHFEFYPHAENEAIFAEVVRSKKPYQAMAKPFVFPDHPEWGVSYWDWTLTPLLNEAGEVEFMVFSLNNVTGRVQAEEARSELLEILEATPDLVATAEADGQVRYLNRAGRKMLGIGEEEDISGLRIADTHPGWAGDLVLKEALPRAVESGVWQGETVFVSRDGREIPTLQVILAHRMPAGQVKFFSTITRDITERKRIEADLRRVNRALRTLSACNQAMVRAVREPDLLQQVCRIIVEEGGYRLAWVGFAEHDQAKSVRPVAQAGYEEGYLENMKVTWADTERGRGPTGTAIRTGQPALARNILTDPHFEPWRAEALKRGYASSCVLPLHWQRRTLGALNIYAAEPDAFSPEEVRLLSDLAANLAFGIAALRTQAARQRDAAALRESEKKLRALTSQLLTVQEEERGRISRELHDGLGQALLVLKLQIRALERNLEPEQRALRRECEQNLRHIDAVIEDVRRLSRALSPSVLEDLGLAVGLRNLCEDFTRLNENLTISLDLDEISGMFPKEAEINIYRIFQESLANVGKHARATRLHLAAKKLDRQVAFAIEDNGRGFQVEEVAIRAGNARGLGLATMAERVRMLGGELYISSKRGTGTRVSFTVPLGLAG